MLLTNVLQQPRPIIEKRTFLVRG